MHQRRTQFVEYANVRAASYIWQPWFVQLSGGLGLVVSQQHGTAGLNTASARSDAGNSRSLVGNGAVSVFPVSRFPFLATYDVTDSRAGAAFSGNDYRSRRLGLRQSYLTSAGDTSYSVTFDRSLLESNAFGADRLDVATASMAKSWATQRVEMNANYTENHRANDEQGSVFRRASGSHSYRPDEQLSVETLASISRNDLRAQSTDGVLRTRSTFRQLNSFFTYRPEVDSPLLLIGTARMFDASIVADDGAPAATRTESASLAANYRRSRNLSLFGNVGLTQFESGSQRDVLSLQGGGFTYLTDQIALGSFQYNGNAGMNVANQNGGPNGRRSFVGGQLGHNLMKNVAGAPGTLWSLRMGQTVGASLDSVPGESHTVTHNGGVSWRHVNESGLLAYAGLTAGDSRTFGANEGEFQLVNLQLSGQAQFDQLSFFNANMTWQATRQSTPANPTHGFTTASSGGATYQHIKAFGVPRLRYSAIFNAYTQSLNSRLQGELNAPREQITWSFENRLEYVIGRLDVRLSLRLAEIDGRKNALVFLRINRQFGTL